MDTRILDPTRLSCRLLIGFAGRERDPDEDKQAAGRPDVEASGALWWCVLQEKRLLIGGILLAGGCCPDNCVTMLTAHSQICRHILHLLAVTLHVCYLSLPQPNAIMQACGTNSGCNFTNIWKTADVEIRTHRYVCTHATAYYVHVCMYRVGLSVKLYQKIVKECSSKGQRFEGRYLSECHGQTNQITVTYVVHDCMHMLCVYGSKALSSIIRMFVKLQKVKGR